MNADNFSEKMIFIIASANLDTHLYDERKQLSTMVILQWRTNFLSRRVRLM